MERVRFTEDGHWNCPRCGAQASGKKCQNCKFLIYAGFLPRIVAGLVDGAITLAAAKLFIILRSNSLDGYLAVTLFGFIFFRLYHILFVALWGQTPGKMIAHIHVVQLDGSPVGWIHAILRNSVETAIVMVVVYFEIQASLHVPAADFAKAMAEQRDAMIKALMPHDIGYMTLVSKLYVYSEYVVMFMNKRKRAIHDFIGGTVVIHDPRQAIFPWRRLKVVRDIADKIEEIDFEDFLERHGMGKGSALSENPAAQPVNEKPENE
jgi:uncharacterized RDD family membrane protein YckC